MAETKVAKESKPKPKGSVNNKAKTTASTINKNTAAAAGATTAASEPRNGKVVELPEDPDQGAEDMDVHGEAEGEADRDDQGPKSRGQGKGQHQENLLTKVVSFDQKSYYLDVRENNRGKYLKLTESSPRRRSTILLSGYVMRALQAVLEDAIKENYASEVKMEELDNHWVTIFSRRVLSMQKKIYIDLMQNKRGRSLNVAEVSLSRPKTSVVMSERGWFQFKRALEEIQAAFPEFGGNSGSSSSGANLGPGANNATRQARNAAAKMVDNAPQKRYHKNKENAAPGAQDQAEGAVEGEGPQTKVLSNKKLLLTSKRFFFDFLENDLGRYCKVSEVRKVKRETVFIPNVCFDIFIKLLELFIKDDFTTAVDGAEAVDAPETEAENHKTLTRRVIRLEGEGDATERKYNFDLRENNFGRFLRLTELRPNRSNCVFFPAENFQEISDTFKEFNEMP